MAIIRYWAPGRTPADVLREPGIAQAFGGMPEHMYTVGTPDRIATLAHATWYARDRMSAAAASTQGGAIPAHLLAEAVTLRGDMLRVCAYHLRGNPEVAAIEAGQGHVDVVSDLTRLVTLCEENDEMLADDKYFSDAWVTRANALYLEITGYLGSGTKKDYRYWQDMQARAFTLLRREYEAVRALAGYVFRDSPDTLARFPSLVAASRKAKRRARAAEATPPEVSPAPTAPQPVAEVA